MQDQPTTILGIFVPSSEPIFLAIVSFHILLGIICVVSGAIAMLNEKVRGRHSKFGAVYFWCLSILVTSASFLSFMRWEHSWHLFFIGIASFLSAWIGRAAVRKNWKERFKFHIPGFGLSYILLLVGFYVDNGPHLPIWKNFDPITYWLLPTAIGLPLLIWAMRKYRDWV
jgi:hypothetical protein